MSDYTFKQHETFVELVFDGDVTIEQSFMFKDDIKEKLTGIESPRVMVDLTEVGFMDSSGLGMLISFFKEVTEQQGEIVYFGVQSYVKKLLGLVKLDQVFKICDSRDDALRLLKIT